MVPGCTAERPEPVVTAAPDPETVLLKQLIEDKERTIARYAAATSSRLAPFRERHEAHLAELRRRLPADPAPAGSPAPATPAPSAPATPAPEPKVSLRSLRDLERKAAALRARQLADASPPLAQLIASIGACEAAHAAALSRSL
nr:hypothetical protein GCM10020093_103480 [Planobispora longispora]